MLISVALGSFGSGYDIIFAAGCWVLLALAQGKKCHLWVFFDHVCVLFCNPSNVWCSDMLAC